jgi:hypothetical protein
VVCSPHVAAIRRVWTRHADGVHDALHARFSLSEIKIYRTS